MRSEPITAGPSGRGASSPSPSATNSIPFPALGKAKKFRQLSRDKRKAALCSWDKFQEIVAHLRHTLMQPGGAADAEAFLKLSRSEQAALLKRKAGAA